MKMLSIVLAVAVLSTAVFAAPYSAATPDKTDQLRAKVKGLQKTISYLRQERAELRRERNEARESVYFGLAPQVATVAKSGVSTQILRGVFEPLRANWPCGSSIFQGTSFWSVDIDLEEDRFDEPDLLCNS